MSDNKTFNENTESLDSFSKEKLMDILRAEYESEDTDVELIRRVSKALDEKDRPQDVDVNAAWERFLKLSSESEPIYDLEEDEVVSISNVKARKRTPLRKAFIAVAAAAVVLIGGTAVANANGIDLWKVVVSWTAETLGFSQKNDIEPALHETPTELEELAKYFDQYGINKEKLPTYIPEGYTHIGTKVIDASTSSTLISMLANGNMNITFQYRLHKDANSYTEIQKDIPDPQIYKLNGIDFYISTNDDLFVGTWIDGSLECLILGVNSYDELIKIINSIYEV